MSVVKPGGQNHKLLLIGWDAADWQVINPLLDSGQMPHLESLVNRGCIGNLATLYPCLSPILWTTIATGHTADRHGILGFVEPLPDSSGVRLSSSLSRKTRALWNMATLQGRRSVIVNWYASHPAEPIHGICVSNEAFRTPRTRDRNEWKLPEGSVFPAELAESLADLRLHPAELAPGDISQLIPLIDQIDHRRDPRPSKLGEIVAKTVSVQSIFTAALAAEPWDFAAVFFDAIDVAGHIFMPYYPPRMPNVSEWDFALYQHVMPELYKFHDQMLGALLSTLDENTRVLLVSDHGFHSGSDRPLGQLQFQDWQEVDQDAEAAQWHRPYGVIAMAGPGIKPDSRLYGATLLDVAPTALELLGLPKGSDMPGRMLKEAFWDEKGVGCIDSWEEVPGNAGQHDASAILDWVSAASEWEVLAELGYLPKRHEGSQAETAVVELEFNLAAVHLHHDRPQEALPILLTLSSKCPNTPRFLKALAKCYHHLKDSKQALEIINRLDEAFIGDLDTDLIAAKCLGAIGESQQANERFRRAIETRGGQAVAWCMWGEHLLDVSDGAGAWDKFHEAVRLSPDLYRAQLGRAKAALMTGRPLDALEAAQEASRIHYYSPMAHYHRGVALERLGRPSEAVGAYTRAVDQQPDFYHAHLRLAEIYQDAGNFSKAFRHNQEVQRLLHQADLASSKSAAIDRPLQTDWNEFLDGIKIGRFRGLYLFNLENQTDSPSLMDAEDVITVVSGLPRSGTSLMMQLIEACGIAPLMDSTRLADENNPRGYYEFEPVKSLKSDASWVSSAAGKAVKIVYPNLLELPKGYHYRVFFLLRDLEEVLQSQEVMLKRNGISSILNHSRLISHWRDSIPKDLEGFQQRTGCQLIVVSFEELYQHPQRIAERLNDWLGTRVTASVLEAVVDTSLYRQRRSSESQSSKTQ